MFEWLGEERGCWTLRQRRLAGVSNGSAAGGTLRQSRGPWHLADMIRPKSSMHNSTRLLSALACKSNTSASQPWKSAAEERHTHTARTHLAAISDLRQVINPGGHTLRKGPLLCQRPRRMLHFAPFGRAGLPPLVITSSRSK